MDRSLRSRSLRHCALTLGLILALGACALPSLPTPAQLTAIGAPELLLNLNTTPIIGGVPAPNSFVTFGDQVYFFSGGWYDSAAERSLWRSDGTAAGTQFIGAFAADSINDFDPKLTVAGDRMYFLSTTAGDVGLWASDGTAEGTRQVRAADALMGNFNLVTDGDTLYFVHQSGSAAPAIWRSDGTDVGTVQLAPLPSSVNLYRDIANWQRTELPMAGGKLYFTTRSQDIGDQYIPSFLVSYDPISGSVVQLTREESTQLRAVGDRLFFTVGNTAYPAQAVIWTSDGTAEGTLPVLEGARADHVVLLNEQYYAVDGHFVNGIQLWALDPVGGDARTIMEISLPGESAKVLATATAGERLFFVLGYETLEVGDDRYELWVSDGTAAGTAPIYTFTAAVERNAPHGLIAVGASLYFAADDGAHGTELWRSDGTAEGTVMVVDLAPGLAHGVPLANEVGHSEGPRFFTAHPLGDRLFFGAITGDDDTALWITDGTAEGTITLGESGRDAGSEPYYLTALGERLLFFADDGSDASGVYLSDGTPQGTALIPASRSDLADDVDALPLNTHRATAPVVLNNALFWVEGMSSRGEQETPWVSDGTAAGTRALATLPDAPPPELTAALLAAGDGATAYGIRTMGGRVYYLRPIVDSEADTYFPSGTIQLWRSDGSAAELVVDTGFPLMGWEIEPFEQAGTYLYFFGVDEVGIEAGMRLWSSDGTPEGTQPLSDQPFADMVLALTPVGERLFFITDDGVHGRELWVSDGTPDGTHMVMDIAPGGSADQPVSSTCRDDSYEGTRMYAYGERLVFAADDGVHGCEPWLSDGTAAGTRMIADLNPGSAGSLNWPTEWFSTRAVVILGEQLIFPATDGVYGTELWISDGSAKGTRLLQDIAPGAATSAPDELAVLNGRLFFSADDGVHGREPWVSDGSTEGTRMIGDIAPGSHGSDAAEWAWLGSRLYFTADDGTHGKEVWTVTMSTR